MARSFDRSGEIAEAIRPNALRSAARRGEARPPVIAIAAALARLEPVLSPSPDVLGLGRSAWLSAGLLNNLFDRKYATFGIFGDVTSTPLPGVPKANDPRFVSVAPPIAAFGGVRVKF